MAQAGEEPAGRGPGRERDERPGDERPEVAALDGEGEPAGVDLAGEGVEVGEPHCASFPKGVVRLSLLVILAVLSLALSAALDAPLLWFVGAGLLGAAAGAALGGGAYRR